MKRLSFLLLFVLISISAAAYVEIDGICYSLDTYPNIASVVPKSSKYSGDVVIPESIEYDGKEFRVTSIGEEAFEGCSNLTSITFPNNLTDIGFWAFEGCSLTVFRDL